jgi:hypothetical protein
MVPRLLLSFLAALLFATGTASAQNAWHWAKRDSLANYSINPSYPRQVVASHKGTSLWGAIQNKKMTYNQLMLGDYKLNTYDTSGNLLATATITGKVSLTTAHSDDAGNWYILGYVYDTVQLSSTMRIVTGFPGSQYFLLRLHAGTLAPDWLQLLGGDQYSRAETFDVSGGDIYLALDSSLTTKICRFSAGSGARTTLWSQTGISYTSSIDADSAGNIYLMGQCAQAGGINFNGTSSAPPSFIQYPWYIARYKAGGQLHWAYWLRDITCTDRSFKLGSSNAVYLSGPLSDSASLAGNYFSKPTSFFNADYLLARLDSNGAVQWIKQRPITSITQGSIYFGTQFHMAAVDTMIYMLCETAGASIWGNGVASQTTSNRHNATLVAYSEHGLPMWTKVIAGQYTTGNHITTDGSSIWITGSGMDSTAISFDSLTVPAVVATHIPYIAKMKVAPPKANPTVGINTTLPKTAVVYAWPNPTSATLFISSTEPSQITLRDITGRSLWTGTSTNKRLEINTSSWPRGCYILEAKTTSDRTTQRILLNYPIIKQNTINPEIGNATKTAFPFLINWTYTQPIEYKTYYGQKLSDIPLTEREARRAGRGHQHSPTGDEGQSIQPDAKCSTIA